MKKRTLTGTPEPQGPTVPDSRELQFAAAELSVAALRLARALAEPSPAPPARRAA